MRAKGPGQSALLLLDVIAILDALRIPYAIIGAVAASFHGVVRASLDADALISLRPGRADADSLMGQLRKVGLKARYRAGDRGDPVGAVINVEDSFRNRVDLLMRIRGMSEEAFARAIETEFMGARIRVISVEDFIAMKLFAGSPRDVSDVVGVLRVARSRMNRTLLKGLVAAYGQAVVRKLEALLRAGKP